MQLTREKNEELRKKELEVAKAITKTDATLIKSTVAEMSDAQLRKTVNSYFRGKRYGLGDLIRLTKTYKELELKKLQPLREKRDELRRQRNNLQKEYRAETDAIVDKAVFMGTETEDLLKLVEEFMAR